jgi:DNA-binding MarR family transcriptional regulator
MKDDRPSLIKLTNYIYRYTQSYTDEVLAKYNLSSGTYPYLLRLNKNEGISQNQISKILNVDKAMSARAVKRLIELEYIKKEENEEDTRAYKLYLTDKAKAIIPNIIAELDRWIDMISEGLKEEEKKNVLYSLQIIMDNAEKHKNNL